MIILETTTDMSYFLSVPMFCLYSPFSPNYCYQYYIHPYELFREAFNRACETEAFKKGYMNDGQIMSFTM